MDKMTNVKALAYVLENCDLPTEVSDKVTAMKASFEKRASRKPVGPTKAQKERIALAERVFEAMESGVTYGSAEIANLLPELEGATPQKISPLMKLLGERIVTDKVKGKAVYSIA